MVDNSCAAREAGRGWVKPIILHLQPHEGTGQTPPVAHCTWKAQRQTCECAAWEHNFARVHGQAFQLRSSHVVRRSLEVLPESGPLRADERG
eukprot:4091148-Pyramimonas_sp.AAC.1